MQNYAKNQKLLVFIDFTRTEWDVYIFRFGLCLSLKTAENIHLWVSYSTVNRYHSEEYNGSSYHVFCDGRWILHSSVQTADDDDDETACSCDTDV